MTEPRAVVTWAGAGQAIMLTLSEAEFGTDNAIYANLLGNLAILFLSQGRYGEAEPSGNQAGTLSQAPMQTTPRATQQSPVLIRTNHTRRLFSLLIFRGLETRVAGDVAAPNNTVANHSS